MARILSEQGDEVQSLTLLDSLAPACWQTLPALEEVALLQELAANLASMYGVYIDLDVEYLQGLSEQESGRYVSQLFAAQGVSIDPEQCTILYRVFLANEMSYRAYRARPLTGDIKITLFKATDRMESEIALTEDFGWNDLLENSLIVRPVRGSHYSMLNRDNAVSLAQLMQGEDA